MTRQATGSRSSVVDLLLELRSMNIAVWADNGRVRYDAPAGAMSGELCALLSERKAEIVAFLSQADLAQRTSTWVTMSDGVDLAVDIFRPKRHGVLVEEPLPVIWCHERYRRAELVDGGVMTKLDTWPWLKQLLRDDYVIAAVDARGTGASAGTRATEFSEVDGNDAYVVTEWLAAQPWSTGRIGMYGLSYSGIAQLLAAATAPGHLKAIIPQSAMFDLYSFLRPGGVFRADFARKWGELVRKLDTDLGAAPAGIADAAHMSNVDVFSQAAALRYLDSVDEATGCALYQELTPARQVDRINASGIPVLHISGWFDIWVRDAVLWFQNLTTPQRLVIGGGSHSDWGALDLAAEHLRWFDYWLKDVDNGVLADPPIRYLTLSNRPELEWRDCDQWPPPGVRQIEFHLRAGPVGSVSSVNDGGLSALGPADAEAEDRYEVDYSTTSGKTTRWTDGYGGGFGYDLTPNDVKALTYTTVPLTTDLEVTGHPVMHLWVSSTHADGDFFAYLEEVDEAGASHYITEGVLRASHRELGQAPFDNLDLPYHPGTADSARSLSDEPVELVVDMHPTSNVITAGRRLRLCITCCDKDNALTPVEQPPPVVRVHRGGRFQSRLILPVMPHG